MATIKNEVDILLQATSPRLVNASVPTITGSSALVFTFTDNVLDTGIGINPDITFTATIVNMASDLANSFEWSINGTVIVGAITNTTTINATAFGTSTAAMVKCKLGSISNTVTINKINISTAGAGATRNIYTGDWTKPKNYVIGDIVLDTIGYGWSCIKAHTSSVSILTPVYPITDNTYWTLYAVKGTDAVSAILSNDTHTLPAASDGTVGAGSYVNSGTTIRVFDGTREVSYDAVGTTNGTWKVVATPTDIVVGTLTDSGKYLTVGVQSGVTAGTDTASISYAVTGKTFNGSDISITVQQSFSKSKAGSNGAQGPTVRVLTNRVATFTSEDNVLNTGQTNLIFTAKTSGIVAASYVWTFYADNSTTAITSATMGVTFTGTPNGQICTITQGQFAAAATKIKSLKVVCVVNGNDDYTDAVTIRRLDNSTAAAGATVGATWGTNITSQPTTLGGINTTEGSKLTGIAAGATVGATIGTNLSGQITSTNSSTFIGTDAIANAQIGGLSATKITTGTLDLTGLSAHSGAFANDTMILDKDGLTITADNVKHIVLGKLGATTYGLVGKNSIIDTANPAGTEVFRVDTNGLKAYPLRSVVNKYGGSYNNPVIQEGTVTLQGATSGTITQYVPLNFFGFGAFKLVVNAIGYAERVGYSTNNYSLAASCTMELQLYYDNPGVQPDLANPLPGSLVGMGSVVLASDHSDASNTYFLGKIIASYPSFCSIMFNSGSIAITDPLGNIIEPKTPYLKLTSRRSQLSTAVTYIRYIVSGIDDGNYIAFANNYGI